MLFVIIPFLVLLLLIYKRLSSGEGKVCVVVLGDIGRSPRVQYHALSLAKHGNHVTFVGYGGSRPPEDLMLETKIKLSHVREVPKALQGLPRLVSYVVKVLWQSATLLWALLKEAKASHLLLQNPPCIPTLAICWLVCVVQNTKLIVDWHNYGYTILGLTLGESHMLVRFSKWYERLFGRFAHSNICVTNAMRKDLKEKWGISATTMHDRPPNKFRSVPVEEQHDLFKKLMSQYEVFKPSSSSKENETAFTEENVRGKVVKKRDRPVLLVSSTSWTEDEDFSILLSALQGKGPLKEYYKTKISQLSMAHVKFCTPWLEAEDYPTLLGSADIGICLHKSSSGLDLPMKVVDMFGCGLPVCAVDFDCLDELVHHNENGLVFQTSQQLTTQLENLLLGFPARSEDLLRFRENLKQFQSVRWQETWNQIVWPLFQD